jgi:hypothetical protein
MNSFVKIALVVAVCVAAEVALDEWQKSRANNKLDTALKNFDDELRIFMGKQSVAPAAFQVHEATNGARKAGYLLIAGTRANRNWFNEECNKRIAHSIDNFKAQV